MKKINSILMLALAFWTMTSVFQSCASESKDQGAMQKPVTESPQAGMEATTSEEMEDDDDDEMNSRKNTSGASTQTQMKTQNFQDMQEAYKGETTASAKYAAYSKKAEAEGFHEIALLFSAASASELTHANNHRAVLEESGQSIPSIKPDFVVRTTKENLEDALAGETYEITTMYPQFISNANTVGNQLSLVSLNYAYKTEQKHKPLYEKALVALANNTVKSMPSVYYVCPTCGNTYENNAPKKCGISMTSSEKFIRITTIAS